MHAWHHMGAAACLALASASASANLTYTFDSDAQGVTATGAALSQGPGYLVLQDTDNADMAVQLPAADLVNGTQYLGGTLSFDAINLNGAVNDWFSFGTVRLTGASGQFVELDIEPGAEPATTWKTYSVALTESVWGANLASVLAQWSGVSITLESHVGFDQTNGGFELNGIDNIRVTSAVPEPGTLALAMAGLALLPWAARRQSAKRH
ncbi:MAG: PEP-CTERM sorting domain-containing protein [Aquabacterium sp.]|jgi:hypothetical protein